MRKQLFILTLGIFVSLFVVEGTIRIASPILGPPLSSWNTMEDAKKLKLDEFQEKFGSPDFLVMGNSTALIGFNPRIFDARMKNSQHFSFNAAMNGSDISTIRDFATSFIIPIVKPTNLVILVSNTPMLFDSNDLPLPRMESNFLNKSYLYRYRNSLRDPMTLNTLIRSAYYRDGRQGIVYRWADNLDDFGYSKYLTTESSISNVGWTPTSPLIDPIDSVSIDASMLKSLIQIRDLTGRNGINLVLGTVPLLSNDRNYRATVKKVADFLGIEFVQGNDALGEGKYFQDGIHLNRQGAEEFSKFMADSLSKYESD
jgi:hypothetical protein